MMPATFSHRLSRPSRQARQLPHVNAPYITTGSPGLEGRYLRTDSGNLAGGFRADHKGKFALGERHAAIAPHVDMVERHRSHPHLNLSGPGRRRRRQIAKLQLAVGDES